MRLMLVEDHQWNREVGTKLEKKNLPFNPRRRRTACSTSHSCLSHELSSRPPTHRLLVPHSTRWLSPTTWRTCHLSKNTSCLLSSLSASLSPPPTRRVKYPRRPVWSNCQIWSDCPLVLQPSSSVTVLYISQENTFLGSSQNRLSLRQ